MATELHVEIVTPEKSAYSGPAREILVPGWEGEFGVLPNHEAFLALLKAGVAAVSTPDGTKRFLVGRGFAEVGSEHVTLLTDSAVLVQDLDKAKLQEEYNAAVQAFESAVPMTEAYNQAMLRVEYAQAGLDA